MKRILHEEAKGAPLEDFLEQGDMLLFVGTVDLAPLCFGHAG